MTTDAITTMDTLLFSSNQAMYGALGQMSFLRMIGINAGQNGQAQDFTLQFFLAISDLPFYQLKRLTETAINCETVAVISEQTHTCVVN